MLFRSVSQSRYGPIKKEAVSQVIDSLTGNGMYEDFVKPIRKALYKNIVFGLTKFSYIPLPVRLSITWLTASFLMGSG